MDPAATPRPPDPPVEPPTERMGPLPPISPPSAKPPAANQPPPIRPSIVKPAKDNLAEDQTSQEQIFQLKGALLTVNGGVIAATVALLGINAQREKALDHADNLVAALIFGSLSMVLVLVALANLDLHSRTGSLVRKLAVTCCIFAIVPLIHFAWMNFSSRDPKVMQADLFGVTLTPQQLKETPGTADPGLVTVLTDLGTSDSTHVPQDHTRYDSVLAPLGVRIAEPMLVRDPLPGAEEVERLVAEQVALELAPVVAHLRDVHQEDKYGSLNNVNPFEHPELDNFLYWSGGEPAFTQWTTDNEEEYLPVFHRWMTRMMVKFVLTTIDNPKALEVFRTEPTERTELFDEWFFSIYLPAHMPPPEPGTEEPPPLVIPDNGPNPFEPDVTEADDIFRSNGDAEGDSDSGTTP